MERRAKTKNKLSISSYLLMTIISMILLVSLLLGAVGIFEINSYVDSSARDMTDIVCESEANEIDFMLLGMEKSVLIMNDYVYHFLPEQLAVPDSSLDEATKQDVRNQNKEQLRTLITKAEEMFCDIAVNTEGAIAFRLRFAPELTSNTTGIHYAVMKEDLELIHTGGIVKEFVEQPLVDLSMYPKEDSEHVGWYWQAHDAKKALWMVPYENEDLGITVITYVMPIYMSDTFVGVVSIDFDYHSLRYKVDEISTYENGFAFLAHHDHIAYHKDYPQKHHIPDYSEDYIAADKELRNGTSLVVLTYKDDLSDVRSKVIVQMVATMLLLTTVFSLITFFIIKWFADPLSTLTSDIGKIAQGQYDISPVPPRSRELKILSDAFANMAKKVEEHDRHQHEIAYRDALTGLRNATSYTSWKDEFIGKLDNADTSFGIAVFDINYLKDTNDKYGHEVGNKLLISAARTISYVFKRSPVFRVGGDEFVVILQDYDLEHYHEHVDKLREKAKNEPVLIGDDEIPVSIAVGVAVYDKETDGDYISVFNRADAAMYENKRETKANAAFK
jgi:diguanylate cyclase (GGDEF)-like protein